MCMIRERYGLRVYACMKDASMKTDEFIRIIYSYSWALANAMHSFAARTRLVCFLIFINSLRMMSTYVIP